ncbi:unnamed protein product [Durusdinium trenchii]|uniref:Uncharacterized protein n=1 Tax=Durusdinium trenchii TaxID=1381693 RepID=A0ABP0I0P4_9DINO
MRRALAARLRKAPAALPKRAAGSFTLRPHKTLVAPIKVSAPHVGSPSWSSREGVSARHTSPAMLVWLSSIQDTTSTKQLVVVFCPGGGDHWFYCGLRPVTGHRQLCYQAPDVARSMLRSAQW